MKKRILMLLQNCPFPRDPRVRHEARSLTEAGFTVTLICPHAKGQAWSETYQGTHVIRFPVPPKFNSFLGYIFEYGYSLIVFSLMSLYVLIRYGFDVLHVHQPPDTSALIAVFYKLIGKAYVMDHHDLAPELYEAHFLYHGNRVVFKALMWLERLALILADRVIATNESYKQIERDRAGVKEEKITIVRNGPDLKERPIRRLSMENDKADGKIILGYVGVMGIQDGVEYFLNAIKLLVEELHYSQIRCVLVGAGDAYFQLKQVSTHLGIDDYVEFTGWIDDIEEFQRHVQSIDIGISPEPSNPYNDSSTFIKVMDYMTFGKPLVAFDLPESRFSAGESALYAKANETLDFARKIEQLILNEDLRKQMGIIGRQRILDKLEWKHQGDELVGMYKTLFQPAINK